MWCKPRDHGHPLNCHWLQIILCCDGRYPNLKMCCGLSQHGLVSLCITFEGPSKANLDFYFHRTTVGRFPRVFTSLWSWFLVCAWIGLVLKLTSSYVEIGPWATWFWLLAPWPSCLDVCVVLYLLATSLGNELTFVQKDKGEENHHKPVEPIFGWNRSNL